MSLSFRTPADSLPLGTVANPYIGTSIGETVADDSGSEDVEEEAETKAPTPRPPMPFSRQSLTRFLMIFLFLLALYAIIDQSVGTAFAAFAGVILFPFIGFGGTLPVLTILLAGLMTTTIGSIIRDRYTNWVKMARTQKVMTAWWKEQMEAMRKGQQTRRSQLKEAQQGFMKDSMEVQTAPMKSMAWTMFMFIVFFTWLRLFVDVVLQNHGNQWIAVPWSNHVFLNSAYLFPSWVLLYSLLALPFGQIVVRLLKYYHFRRRLQAMGVPLRPGPDETA